MDRNKILKILKSENQKAILIDNFQRLIFFKKIIKRYDVRNFTFLHANLSTYQSAIKEIETKHILLRRGQPYSNNIDCIENYTGYNHQNKFYKLNLDNLQFKELWIFNGYQFNSKNLIKELPNCSVIYFEIGNFSNKFQIGIGGINSQNQFAKNIILQDNIKIYPSINYFDNIIQKSQKNFIGKLKDALLNYYGFVLLKTLSPKRNLSSILLELLNRYRCRKILRNLKFSTDLNEEYCLFIAQVKNDTQTIFQSNESPISLLKKAEQIAVNRNLKLIIRLHPREFDLHSTKEIIKYSKNRNIFIDNITHLEKIINNSKLIITCNSTLGVQSLSLNKEVITLGDAFYESWDKRHLEYYYHEVLMDF